MCTDWRQEFILLSDTLGVSMLVETINNRKPSGATETTVLGPFHIADAPLENGANISLDGKGEPGDHRPGHSTRGQADQGRDARRLADRKRGAYDVQEGIQPDMNLAASSPPAPTAATGFVPPSRGSTHS